MIQLLQVGRVSGAGDTDASSDSDSDHSDHGHDNMDWDGPGGARNLQLALQDDGGRVGADNNMIDAPSPVGRQDISQEAMDCDTHTNYAHVFVEAREEARPVLSPTPTDEEQEEEEEEETTPSSDGMWHGNRLLEDSFLDMELDEDGEDDFARWLIA